jgi:hypothetical protein
LAMVPARDNTLPDSVVKAVESGELNVSSGEKLSYLKVEIHTIGQIEHRLYRLKNKKIDGLIDLKEFPDFASLQSIEETYLDDFAIIVVHNVTSTKEYHGMDDYSDIADIIRELEWRYGQILATEDKFTDPWGYGPAIEEQDPRDGQFKITGGSKYITLTEGMSPPGKITWDANMPANFLTIDHLMQRLYEISETCKVVFDASAGGQGLSAQALKVMLTAPLKKANRLQTRLDPAVKKAIHLCSLLETKMGLKGSVEIPDLKITWHDGLPQDHNADAQRESMLVTGKVRSAQGLMRDNGMPEDQIRTESDEMAAQGL